MTVGWQRNPAQTEEYGKRCRERSVDYLRILRWNPHRFSIMEFEKEFTSGSEGVRLLSVEEKPSKLMPFYEK